MPKHLRAFCLTEQNKQRPEERPKVDVVGDRARLFRTSNIAVTLLFHNNSLPGVCIGVDVNCLSEVIEGNSSTVVVCSF